METGLLFVEDFELAYFEDLIQSVADDGVSLEVESRTSFPMAAMEWLVLTGVAMYIAKPFVDKFLAKAAADAVEAGYPKLKAALQALVKRVDITDRSRFRTLTSAGAKVVDEGGRMARAAADPSSATEPATAMASGSYISRARSPHVAVFVLIGLCRVAESRHFDTLSKSCAA